MEPLEFKSKDGFALKGNLFSPSQTPNKPDKPFVLISAATGVPAKFYHKFAEWLASRGCQVMTWDFRLIGRSFPQGVEVNDRKQTEECLRKNPHINIVEHWARDYEAALTLAIQLKKEKELVAVGNSLGCHLAAVPDESLRSVPKRYVMVSSNSPHISVTPDADMLKMAWNEMAPQIVKEKGFFDGSSMALGGNIPTGCFEDWKRWCLSETSDRYIAGDPKLVERFLSFQHKEVVSVAFDDDTLITADFRQIESFLRTLGSAKVTLVKVRVEEYGIKNAGHVNAFKSFGEDKKAWELLEGLILHGSRFAEGKKGTEIKRIATTQSNL